MRIKPTATHPQPTPLTLEKQGVNFSGAAKIYIKKKFVNSSKYYKFCRQLPGNSSAKQSAASGYLSPLRNSYTGHLLIAGTSVNGCSLSETG